MLSAQTKIPRLRAPFPARPPRRARGQSRFARDDNFFGGGLCRPEGLLHPRGRAINCPGFAEKQIRGRYFLAIKPSPQRTSIRPAFGSLRAGYGERKGLANGQRGLTLIELIVAISLLTILVGAAMPIARVRVQRERERELRRDLWEMRDAIDRYKDAADRGAFQIKLGSEGYPPDLETLVKGVDVQGKTLRFLRRIPVDPLTGNTEWGLRSMQDEPDSSSWGGQNVFDVYTKSQGTALDGTKYSEW